MLMFSVIIFSIPSLNFWILLLLLPAVSMVFAGMVSHRIEQPFRFFHFTKPSEIPVNRERSFRKDLLIYGLTFYAGGVLMTLIYKRADFLTGSAGLIGSVVLFAIPCCYLENHKDNEVQVRNLR